MRSILVKVAKCTKPGATILSLLPVYKDLHRFLGLQHAAGELRKFAETTSGILPTSEPATTHTEAPCCVQHIATYQYIYNQRYISCGNGARPSPAKPSQACEAHVSLTSGLNARGLVRLGNRSKLALRACTHLCMYFYTHGQLSVAPEPRLCACASGFATSSEPASS